MFPLVLTRCAAPVLAGCAALTLAACGQQPVRATSHPATARPTSAAPAASPSPGPTVSPAAAAAQPGPLVVVRSRNGAVAAAKPDGTIVWSFDPARLGISTPSLVTGGSGLFVYGGGQVAVIDRAGAIVGHGTYSKGPALSWYPDIFPSPTGALWTWTTLDAAPGQGTANPGPQVSSLWVAGSGQAPRRVRTWTGDYSAAARQWSDAGIVVLKVTDMCGWDVHSSELVDPATGSETPLFGAALVPLDVHAGVQVAMSTDTPSVQVAGAARLTRTFDLPVQKAGVAPSGDRLFVTTFGMTGCGGVPRAMTAVIDAGSGSATAIDGFFADAWLDDDHLLGRTLTPEANNGMKWSAHLQVADLAGSRSDLVLGTLVGVLR